MRLICLLIILPFFLGSCASRIPEPITYIYSQQNKMQASHHWEVLAADLANRINNELILTDNIDKAVFVKETCGDEAVPCGLNETSSFNEAFRDLLITHLVGFGIPTRNQVGEETLQILYKVQIVRHTADRARSLQPGLLTGLSAAIVVLRNAPTDLIILATGAAADVANTSLTFNEHFEVIITTSIVKRHEYLFRASDIYYINDKDFWHYQNQLPQTKTIKLSGVKKPEAEISKKTVTETVVIQPAPLPPPPSTKKDI
jgi:hypothetical protein